MAWGESKVWQRGTRQADFYRRPLGGAGGPPGRGPGRRWPAAAARPVRDTGRRRLVKPEEMPWELSSHGLLKHMVNEQMHTRAETLHIYMQGTPPGGPPGRHRHP